MQPCVILRIKLSYFPSLVPIEDLIKSVKKGDIIVPVEMDSKPVKNITPENSTPDIPSENIQNITEEKENKTELTGIDIRNLPAGIYLLDMTFRNGNKFAQKIIHEN